MGKRLKSFLAVIVCVAVFFSSVCTVNATTKADYIPLTVSGALNSDFEIDVDFTATEDIITGVSLKAVYDTALLECVGVDYSECVQNGLYDDGLSADNTGYAVVFFTFDGLSVNDEVEDFVTLHFRFTSDDVQCVPVEIRCIEYMCHEGESVPKTDTGVLIEDFVFSKYCTPQYDDEFFMEHMAEDNWVYDVEPTCTEGGTRHKICSGCGEYVSEDVGALGHDFVLESTDAEHPHTKYFGCSRCTEETSEPSVLPGCVECDFTLDTNTAGNYVLSNYVGTLTEVVIPAEYKNISITAISDSSFANNTDITSVTFSSGMKSIGNSVFKNCTSLQKVVIPYSVTTIKSTAFDGFSGVIYCVGGSIAHQYAIENNINYQLMGITEKNGTEIDYTNRYIYTACQCCGDVNRIINADENTTAEVNESYQYGSVKLLGTGSTVNVTCNGESVGEYTVVVFGDTDGDSICDALDCVQVQKASSGRGELDGAFLDAGDLNCDGVVDANDYQAIINKAIE